MRRPKSTAGAIPRLDASHHREDQAKCEGQCPRRCLRGSQSHPGDSGYPSDPPEDPPSNLSATNPRGYLPRSVTRRTRHGDGEDCLDYAKSLAPRCRSLLALSSTLRKITAGREHRRGLKVAFDSPRMPPKLGFRSLSKLIDEATQRSSKGEVNLRKRAGREIRDAGTELPCRSRMIS